MAVDLCDPPKLAAALPGELDAVVYAVAADGRDVEAYRRAYVEGLSNLIAALPDGADAPRLLFTSSTSVNAQDGGAWVDETSPTEPTAPTARVLVEAEACVAGAPGSASILRLGGIYGPGRTRLLEQVRSGEARIPAGPPVFTNRIHRDDAAGALDHLLKLSSVDPVYLGVDDEPADLATVLRWLAERLGAPAPRVADEEGMDAAGRRRRTSKRCSNRRLREAGYAFRYPSFREGYGAMLAGIDPA
ncbi:MAG: SDR family NAD(P)-dependent oxidoreductase [Myxococcales bacterium]|nr:SDR family NAD(P)-dependent oxidoreductase [Myxococcales bacterium]